MTERSPKELERDIAETRSDLRQTIDAIQEKLSPGELVDQMLDYFRSGGGASVTTGASEFAGNLGRTVRQNPMPVALVGLGLTWLMLSGSRDDRGRHRYDEFEGWDDDEWVEDDDLPYDAGRAYDEDVTGAYAGAAGSHTGLGEPRGTAQAGSTSASYTTMRERAQGMAGAASETVSALGERVGDAASAVGEQARETGRGIRGRARHAAGRARHAAEEVGHQAAEFAQRAGESAQRGYGRARRGVRRGVGHASDAARDQVDRARGGFSHMLNEQPLVVGAAGVALGALLGALLPPTRREDKWLGETRDELIESAEDAARQEWDRAQRIAERVIDTVSTEAKREGISREGVEQGLEATEERLRHVAQAVRSEAEQQGLSREGIDQAVRAAEDKLRRIASAARDAAVDEAKKPAADSTARGAASGTPGTASGAAAKSGEPGASPTGGAATSPSPAATLTGSAAGAGSSSPKP